MTPQEKAKIMETQAKIDAEQAEEARQALTTALNTTPRRPGSGPEINPEDLKAILNKTAFSHTQDQQGSLGSKSIEELLEMRSQIDALLPPMTLSSLDLEDELVRQYYKVKSLQDRVLTDTDIPPNQAAQVSNSVAATLQRLVEMQTKHHTSERYKTLEGLMIRSLKRMPIEVAEEFLKEYEVLD